MESLTLGCLLPIIPCSKERTEAWRENTGPGGGKCIPKLETFNRGGGEDFKEDD